MRLGTKLLLSFLAVAFLVLLTGSLSYYLSNEIKNALIDESQQSAIELQILTEMTVTLQNSMLYTRNFLTESEKLREGDQSLRTSSQVRQAREMIIESTERFLEAHERYSDQADRDVLESPELLKLHERMNTLMDSLIVAYGPYRGLIDELLGQNMEGNYEEEIFNVTIEPYFRNTLLPLLENLRNNSNLFLDLQQAKLEARADQTVRRIILITVLGFAASLLFAFIIYRSITQPVNTLTSAAKKIGSGNLDQRIKLRSKDELSRLADTFNQMAENLSKSMVSRSYVNNIIQSMGDMLFVTNDEGLIQMSNKTVHRKLGYNNGDLEHFSVWNIIEESDRDRIKKKIVSNDLAISELETKIVSKEGHVLPVILSTSVLSDEVSEDVRLVFVASDISVQKESEQRISESLHEKNILLAEIHHRVKNNLAVISGLLQMQMWNVEDESAKIALQHSQLRIQSIALVHEKLYQNETFADINISDFARELVDAVSESFKQPEQEVLLNYNMDNIKMNINQAVPLSLLLNECIVNCYKHAFAGRDNGEIDIDLGMDGDKVNIQVTDNGHGLPEGFDFEKQQSLGVTLIRTLVSQLRGEARYTSNGKGTRFSFEFKLEEVA
ncbi:MAG TPA: histidine kinase dimerization/phosphoacceptor domain -containing protein [Balneolaceae bacterium]|nr:histidine kinase dimerization/phosphoacceptor domain -containing protein [Balneolaceae bacterium]